MKTSTALLTLALIASTALFALPRRSAANAPDARDAEIARLQSEVAQLTADAKRARQLPVRVIQRKALTGPGQVLHLENLSPNTIPLKVTLISPTFGKTNTFELVVDGAEITPRVKEIGHKQGWAGTQGDLIEIQSAGFEPILKHF